MKVLVVGGAGYIGSVVTRELWDRGNDVTVLDSLLFGKESLNSLEGKERYRLIKGDMRDEVLLKEIMPGHDAVCLFAAIVGEPACNRDPQLAVDTNLNGTRNVLAATQAAGIERFIFASTCSNYGVADSEELVDEEAPLRPLSVYSETKIAAEQEILAAAGPNFHPCVLRFSTAFGISPRMRFDLLVSDFTLAAVRDRKIVIFGEQFWRPFVHVRDIAGAIVHVLGSDADLISGQVFNVGSNESNTQKLELGRRVQQQVPGTEIEIVKRETDPRSYRVDFTKMQNRLGFTTKWSVDDGITELHAALNEGVWSDPSAAHHYN